MKHSVYMSAPYILIYLFNILPNKCILLHRICNVSVISSLLQMLPYIPCGTFTVIVNNISLGALVIIDIFKYGLNIKTACHMHTTEILPHDPLVVYLLQYLRKQSFHVF